MSIRNNVKIVMSGIALVMFMTASISCVSAYASHGTYKPIVDHDFSDNYFDQEYDFVLHTTANYGYWHGMIVSESANFENSNEAVCVHFLDDGKVEVLRETGEKMTCDFKDLISNYEVHVYLYEMPETFDTSGNVSSNYQCILKNWDNIVDNEYEYDGFN